MGCVFGRGRELAAAPDDVIEATKAYVRSCVDHAALQGATLVVGAMYTSVGRSWRLAPDERRAVAAEVRDALAELGDYAGARGVTLGVEPLNRYQTSLFNTAEQIMELVDSLPSDTVGVNLDTFHMNIEEKSWSVAFDAVGDRLVHLQTCGNDRGAPGDDHTDWHEIALALADIDYRGPLAIESFAPSEGGAAQTVPIWRPLAASQDALAQDGLRFLRRWREEIGIGSA